jgi:hypothetical protein
MEDEREDVYTKVVRAGKRTYYFDVRSTRANDLYQTITERKKYNREDGSVGNEKHNIFLYKEDFAKFSEGLQESLDALEQIRAGGKPPQEDPPAATGTEGDAPPSGYTDLDFDDLGKP